MTLGFLVSHPRNMPLFGVAHVECAPASCACKCISGSRKDAFGAMNSSGCSFDSLSNQSSLVTVVTYLNLDVSAVSESSVPSAQALHAASNCPVDTCELHVRNALAGSDGRFRVVVRALVSGLNDWRTRWLREDNILRAGMGYL